MDVGNFELRFPSDLNAHDGNFLKANVGARRVTTLAPRWLSVEERVNHAYCSRFPMAKAHTDVSAIRNEQTIVRTAHL